MKSAYEVPPIPSFSSSCFTKPSTQLITKKPKNLETEQGLVLWAFIRGQDLVKMGGGNPYLFYHRCCKIEGHGKKLQLLTTGAIKPPNKMIAPTSAKQVA